MTTLFIVLIIIVSILLALIVLIQNPKGGGLNSGFAGGSNLMGVQRTGDFLEKGTWTLVILLMVFSLGINILGPSGSSVKGGLSDQIEAPATTPKLNLNTAPTQQEAAPATTAPDSSK
ncbi:MULTISPECIES: preprotein translocase subunit SecG [Sphingobacterium]|jgi:preprotein translocase subunit SecG|uniref:Protein-export membrane protein SecG n=1 Tax=Sphingobacterium litopenaei TaxID=2763500 RepID=A0ABR7YF32_9SPHI|nr:MULTISPECIES: preprotein translocase subunit SecG [Sphingobacterium]MBD1429917.1 preprotein translocase subunit SecG [Sphingobacterium litopenaei]NGM74377.1 preprotein translocase subunit SecG [Sphingobacterium sp. SGL-16]